MLKLSLLNKIPDEAIYDSLLVTVAYDDFKNMSLSHWKNVVSIMVILI